MTNGCGGVSRKTIGLRYAVNRETVGVSTLLSTLVLASSVVELRRATLEDLGAIVRLLADDPLGQAREEPGVGADLQPYRRAFELIDADPAQLLVVATGGDEVVGTMQLSLSPAWPAAAACVLRSRRYGYTRATAASDWEPRWSSGRSLRHGAAAAPLCS